MEINNDMQLYSARTYFKMKFSRRWLYVIPIDEALLSKSGDSSKYQFLINLIHHIMLKRYEIRTEGKSTVQSYECRKM